MVTTIAIREETKLLLDALKEETKAKNFDEVIQQMIGKAKKPSKSFFGAIPNLGEFKREEIDRFA